MDKYRIDDLVPLSQAIIGHSEKTIVVTPNSVYEYTIKVESIGKPITLACYVRITDRHIEVRFEGTGTAVRSGINVPICYTRAMSAYTIKCSIIPTVPNNKGCVRPVSVSAPEGRILNAQLPSSTEERYIIDHIVNLLIFGALAGVIPSSIQADSGMFDVVNFQGMYRNGYGVSSIYFASGGFDALDGLDGAPTTLSPSNLTSATIVRKEFLQDSGGTGKYHGGLGREIANKNDSGSSCKISTLVGRTEFSPFGMLEEIRKGSVATGSMEKMCIPKGDTCFTQEMRLK